MIAIEALAWTGFIALSIANVFQILNGTVEISKSHGTVGLFLYVLIMTWSCFHLLRFA